MQLYLFAAVFPVVISVKVNTYPVYDQKGGLVNPTNRPYQFV